MKRGLVLSGGGSKGSYESGAISYLLGEKGIHYDVVAGVSVGALNGATLCMFKKGEEIAAAEFLKNVWFNIDDSKVWKEWFPLIGKLFALWKPSVYNTKPLQSMVRNLLDQEMIRNSGKQLRVGAVNLTTGSYRVFNELYKDIPGAVLASSSFPVAFEPIKLEGHLWSDGGLREVTPLQAAIDAGCDEVDVVITSPEYVPYMSNRDPKTISIGLRSIDIMSDQIIVDDVKKAVFYNKLFDGGVQTTKRSIPLRIIRPSGILNENSLRFDSKEAMHLHKIGFEDAKRVIESGITF